MGRAVVGVLSPAALANTDATDPRGVAGAGAGDEAGGWARGMIGIVARGVFIEDGIGGLGGTARACAGAGDPLFAGDGPNRFGPRIVPRGSRRPGGDGDVNGNGFAPNGLCAGRGGKPSFLGITPGRTGCDRASACSLAARSCGSKPSFLGPALAGPGRVFGGARGPGRGGGGGGGWLRLKAFSRAASS